MSDQDQTIRQAGGERGTEESKDEDIESLRAQNELLQEEVRRLRREYTRAKQTRYKHTAVGLAGVGIIALLAGVLFPVERTVLLALGATGLFSAVLTYFLTPERFVAASVGERIYASLSENHARIVAALGLQDERVYVPFEQDGRTTARLFVPQQQEYEIPDNADLAAPMVVTENSNARGVSLRPTSSELFEDVETGVTGELSEQPGRLVEQVGDTLVESFELAEAISVETNEGQAIVGVKGSVYGDVERFDHPIVSLFGTALAVQLGTPVSVTTRLANEPRSDVLITYRWEPENEAQSDD